MKKRMFSMLLAIVMVLGLLPAVTPYARAADCTNHTFENNEWYPDAWHHYRKCDKCNYYAGGNDNNLHSDDDSDCFCDVCGYAMHQIATLTNLGENHTGDCSKCEQPVTSAHVFDEDRYDSEVHWFICDCGATNETAAHTYDNDKFYGDAAYHYVQCDSCSYYKPEGTPHSLTGAEGTDKTCTCGYTAHNYAWDQATWNATQHWVKCSVCGNAGWQSHSDGNDEDQNCDVCGLNMDCEHKTFSRTYDGSGHWDSCRDCGASFSSKLAHSFDNGLYQTDSSKHYPECDACEYYEETDGSAHKDEDEDTNCDVCKYLIHEHTYGPDDWACDSGKHYPVCNLCRDYIEEKVEACTDENGDHLCDKNDQYMEWLCYDENKDHICDVVRCKAWLTEQCRNDNDDDDKNHVCDTCETVMDWLCSDVNGDLLCDTDTCGRGLCYHWFADAPNSNNDGTHTGTCGTCSRVITEDCWLVDPVSNNDGTHTGTCGGCEAEITEDCSVWEYTADDDDTHTGYCECGYVIPGTTGEHAYAWSARSMAGHWLYCSDCNYKKWEAHTTTNGTCEVCEMQVSAYADVYVGGVGLTDGEYLDNGGNVSTTQPDGGYAYYSSGVLELNNYVYEGSGIKWNEYDVNDVAYASIYATTDLILVLNGANSLTTVLPDAATYESGDGIAAQQDLTIRGDGSLTIQAEDDGIKVELGNLIIKDGTLTVNSDDDGIDMVDGNLIIEGGTLNVYSGDNGIDMAEGDLIIEGGTLTVYSDDGGIYMGGGVTVVTGGTVTIDAGDCGLDCESDVTISGGVVSITAESDGIWAKGYVDILDGKVSIKAKRNNGILAWGDIVVSGGEITINAGYYGLSSLEDIEISGGKLTVSSVYVAIRAESEVTISGGTVDTASEYAYGIYGAEGGVVISGGDVIARSQNGVFFTNPTIDNVNPWVWYGDSEDNAVFLSGEPDSGYHESKYVRITICNLSSVGGTKVTVETLSGEGWRYAPGTNTLTLTNAVINNESGEGIKATGDLTIRGTGTVTGSTYGIYVDGMLSVEAGSVITMTGTTAALAVRDGILTTDVIVSDPKNYALGSVEVGAEERYTTYGTRDEEYEFTPATTVKFEPGYVVSFDVGDSMDHIEYQEVVAGGKAVKPDDPTLDGCTFGGWYTDEECTVAYDFDTPITEDLCLYAKWTKTVIDDGTPSVPSVPIIPIITPTYPPVIDNPNNGDVVVTPAKPEKGDTVTITPDPDAGYEVDEVIVTDKNGNSVTVVDNGDGTYSFKQPTGKVTITVTFKEIDTTCPRDRTCPMYGYTDLDRTEWYHDGVHFCIEHGLMQGVGNNQFTPNGTTTRAMIVTILWRLEGSPVINYAMDFEDVAANQWYTEAIRWAASEKIVEGYGDGKFGTNDPITREQMVTIMFRYAKYKGYDVSVGENTNILSYDDAFDVADWAIPAMQWACGESMITGIADGSKMNLAPQGNATRAQAAAILQRFIENVVNEK